MIDEKKLEKYKRELDHLDSLSTKLDSFISNLRAEQLLVKNKVEELTTWKSGNAAVIINLTSSIYFSLSLLHLIQYSSTKALGNEGIVGGFSFISAKRSSSALRSASA
ncbi:hypothetical protein SAMN04487776_11045 [Priestia megaterium]|nr:hypothetical protein SAMN04487776_11045 [Priestia megaterium]